MDSRLRHRVVFLVDISLSACEKCQHAKEILTSIIRLLSLFSGSRYQSEIHTKEREQAPKDKLFKDIISNDVDLDQFNKPHITWGVKFFNTNSTLPRNKSDKCSCYNKVNNNIFEHLENKMRQMFDPALTSGVKRKSISHPSEYLTTAFRDILHEFEWQGQDHETAIPKPSRLSSKLSSSGHCATELEPFKHIFVFSRVPTTKQCLRRFCNKVVLDSDVFVDSIMSPSLFAEYMDKLKTFVSWVDLTSSFCNRPSGNVMSPQSTFHQSISIVKEAMKKLGGTLLHRDYLINHIPCHGDPFEFSLSDCYETPTWLCHFPFEAVLPSLLSSVSPSRPEISCPLILQGCNTASSLKLLSLEKTSQRDGRFVEFQNPVVSSSVQLDVSMPESNYDIDFNNAKFELIGFVLSADFSKALSSIEIVSSFLLNCDNNPLQSSLLHHMLSSHSLGILKIHIKSRPQRKVCRFALMSAYAAGIGFISVLSQKACLKMKEDVLDQAGMKGDVNSIAKSYDQHLSHILEQFNESRHERLDKSAESFQRSLSKASEIFDTQTMNSWHVPGSCEHIGALINKQNDSLKGTTQCSQEILKDLKKYYLKARQPYKLSCTPHPSTSAPEHDISLSKADMSGGSESERKASVDRIQRRSDSLSRGRLMVDRARSASLSFLDDSEGSLSSKHGNLSRRASDSIGFADLNLETEDCLVEYLAKQYNQVLGAGIAMEVTIQAMMTVACHFMSNKQLNNPQKEAVAFIRKHVSLEPSKLKEKYDKMNSLGSRGQGVTEYKLQVILRLEMESFVPESDRSHQDDIVKDLTCFLRPLSFACGVTELRSFLESLSKSYSGTLPQILVDVHDELDQPYPSELAKFASPSAPSSAWGPSLSVMSDSILSGPGSSQPSSNQMSQAKRSGRLKQHPSFADFGQKKQILVNKPESKSKPKASGKRDTKDKGKQKVKPQKGRNGVDYDRAKRNLFSDKSKVTPKKKRERRQPTPRGKKEKPKLLVPGTPAHKQTSQRILRKQQKLREYFNIKPEVQVVAESPVKDDGKRGDNRPARLIVRQSFYSSNTAQSRNVAKSLELKVDESKARTKSENFFYSTRSHGSLASAVRGESPLLSPHSRIIKSFCTSPSPGKKSDGTPRSSYRRSPRKSAKRLIFTESATDQQNRQAKKETINPRLVFDGENASDIHLMNHNRDSELLVCEGFKTPEKKRRSRVREDIYEAVSLPSFPRSSPGITGSHENRELDFRNVFSSQDASLNQTNPPQTASSSHISSSIHLTTLHSHTRFSSPDQAAKLRSSFLQSPKRKSPAKAISSSSFSSAIFETKARRSMSFKSPTKHFHGISPTKKHQPSCSGEEGLVFTTPKKAVSSPEKHIQCTPSKVTFSDSCFTSPSKVDSHPPSCQKLTPKKSILKNSPAFKTNLANKIQEACLHSPQCKNQDRLNNEDVSPSFIRKRKGRDFSEVGSISFQDPFGDGTGLSNAENISSISGIKRRILSFDATASSSSNECSNHAHPSGVATTVVTVHTPSPTKKCKTPDVNKWMRKKRHSGSRNCSSSSSSPSLFSSPSSNECKIKGQSKDPGTKSETAGVDSKDAICENLPLKDENLADCSIHCEDGPMREKCLKKSLFSTGENSTSSKPGNASHGQLQCTKSKVHRLSENCPIKSCSWTERSALPTIHSGGFDPNVETSSFTQEADPLPSISHNKPLSSKVSVGALLEEKKLSCSAMPYLTRQTSSFGLESSQGFQLLPTSPYRSHPQAVSSDLDSTSASPTSQNTESPKNMADPAYDQQPLFGSPPSELVIRTTPTKTKKQFSPALSSSGLLQLIKSPLLDVGAKRSALKTGKERKRGGKSRKNLE